MKKKEEVEDELNQTIKALEQVVVLSNTEKPQPLEIATSASLGNYSNFLDYIETRNNVNGGFFLSVTQAAVSVRDAAGAVREVAQNILKVKHLLFAL